MDLSHVGVVVIGRNEGPRLGRCLESVSGCGARVVYVDSASTDDSVAVAESMGVETVRLDSSVALSAARARNAGVDRLAELDSGLSYVQFVDGDCEVIDGWLEAACRELETRSDVVIVCGRVRERFPEASIYNRLCDMEWDQPVGETDAVGGIFMVRMEAFGAVDGFDPSVVAGEEPEMCMRLRARGHKLLRVGGDMVWHDADMTRFSHWWKRQVRNGYGMLDVASRFNYPAFRAAGFRSFMWVVGWCLSVVVAGALAGWIGGAGWGVAAGVMAFLILPLQMARVAFRGRQRGLDWGDAAAYGFFTMFEHFPQFLGQLRYRLR